jgi:hypothetical protein
MAERLLIVAIGMIGMAFTTQGLWAAMDAESFGRLVADFGPRNDHLIHDYAAASLAIGLGLLVAALRAPWRVPILAVAALWNGLHTVSHVVDHGQARTEALGTAEAILLALATGVLVAAAASTRQLARRGRDRRLQA